MNTKNRWTRAGALVALGAAAAFTAVPRADAEDPTAAERAALVRIRAAFKTLVTTQDGPVPGTPKEKAIPMLASWAQILTDWMIPLESSPYTLGPDVKGLVRVFVGERGADDLSIHLFLKDVERARLRAFVMEAGRALGYSMEDDDENRWACSGSAPGRRGVRIGVGIGLVSIEVNPPP